MRRTREAQSRYIPLRKSKSKKYRLILDFDEDQFWQLRQPLKKFPLHVLESVLQQLNSIVKTKQR